MRFRSIKGTEGLVFGLALALLPVNLAKHFIFNFCYVEGILVDYLIPTIYLTDILIGTLLFLGLFRFLRCKQYHGTYPSIITQGTLSMSNGYRGTSRTSKVFVALGLGIITVAGLSVFKALNQPAAVYKWLKLVEYILFAFYVSKHIDLKKDFSTIVRLLSIGVLFQSVLVIAQWFKQGSIFGFWFLGENKYTVSTPGIAILDFTGIRKARPYGTFPHPNVLGGYLAIILPWIFYMGLKEVKGIKEIKRKRFYFLTLTFGLVALFLSFSRSAWVVAVLGLLALFPSSLYSSFMILNSLSFLRRAELNWIALEIIKDHPLFGVGLNNFTVAMSQYGKVSGWTRFLQPAHNVYLLIASEIGLIGLIVFLCLLFSAFRLLLKKKNYLLLISLTQIILLCFVDHYFWTLPQTSLLFWLLVGIVFSSAALSN